LELPLEILEELVVEERLARHFDVEPGFEVVEHTIEQTLEFGTARPALLPPLAVTFAAPLQPLLPRPLARVALPLLRRQGCEEGEARGAGDRPSRDRHGSPLLALERESGCNHRSRGRGGSVRGAPPAPDLRLRSQAGDRLERQRVLAPSAADL